MHWHICSMSTDLVTMLYSARFDDGIESVQRFINLSRDSLDADLTAKGETALYQLVTDGTLTTGVITNKGKLTFVWIPCEECVPFLDN